MSCCHGRGQDQWWNDETCAFSGQNLPRRYHLHNLFFIFRPFYNPSDFEPNQLLSFFCKMQMWSESVDLIVLTLGFGAVLDLVPLLLDLVTPPCPGFENDVVGSWVRRAEGDSRVGSRDECESKVGSRDEGLAEGLRVQKFDLLPSPQAFASSPSPTSDLDNPYKPEMEIGESSGNRPIIKTSSKWNSSGACPPKIDEALVFYPSTEEFNNVISYIAKIRPQAERHGICKIVPPSSWVPPCPLKEKDLWENAKFPTRIQQINYLQTRKRSWVKKRKRGRPSFRDIANASLKHDEKFGFQPGLDFTLNEFQQHANAFKDSYFGYNRPEPSVKDIEGEYWRIIEKPTGSVEVYYGTDLDTGLLGSGFPKASSLINSDSDQYTMSGWNLNNLARLPGSALCFEGNDIPGVLVPWLYVGMCFSTFCWHVEDHHLYSLNYLHWGDPKVWYGVPGSHLTHLEESVRRHLPRLFAEQPDLLNELVTQFTPSILQSEGIPVYRTVQNAGEFILTFPKAYHGGFSCGFNCAEAVNVAPYDWFVHGQDAAELYSQQCRKTSLSHDKVLFGSAEDAVLALAEKTLHGNETLKYLQLASACGKDGVLTEALRTRMMMEKDRLLSLPIHITTLKMDKNFDLFVEKECFSCFYDLHQSAVCCQCSPDRYSCLKHSTMLCKCEMDKKVILCRYTLRDMSTLVAALEGEKHAIEAWAKRNTGVVSAQVADEQHMERAMCKNKSKEKGESSTFLAGTSEKYNNPNALSSSNSHVSSELVHEGSHREPLSTPNEAMDCHENNVKDKQLVIGNEINKEVQRGSSLDLNLNLTSDEPDSNHYKDLQRHSYSREQLMNMSEMEPVGISKEISRNKSLIENVCDSVELVRLGSVVFGKGWSSKHGIYPKGFKSCVKFFSIRDPANLCNYVSEVIDVGLLGPIFKVTMEGNPNETFTQGSADKCWGTVLKFLIHEIDRRESLGEQALPPLELLQAINGHQMFGFLSPSIIQSIEALDPSHQCVEYWNQREKNSKSSGRAIDGSKCKVPHGSSNSTQGISTKLFGVTLVKLDEDDMVQGSSQTFGDMKLRLQGLLKKASPDELSAMHQLFSSDAELTQCRGEFVELIEEIQKSCA